MALTAPDVFDWLPIDEAAGVSFSEVHREKLAESISRYLLNLAFEKNEPAAEDLRKQFQAITRNAEELADTLAAITTSRQAALNAIWPWGHAPDPSVVRSLLRELAFNSELCLRNAAGRKGRRPLAALRQLFLDVQSIWHDAGGDGWGCYWHEAQSEFTGKMVKLLEALVGQVPDAELPKSRTIKKIVDEFKKQDTNSPT